MSYKIAIGSSDGVQVDLKFGEVQKFLIYEVDENATLVEERIVNKEDALRSVDEKNKETKKCGEQNGCGTGCGCGGTADVISRVSLIDDCRCVVCKKIGFQAQKQFEKKAISVFDVECSVKKALEKITYYYNKIDKHETFRKS